jgi:hypothetical protein
VTFWGIGNASPDTEARTDFQLTDTQPAVIGRAGGHHVPYLDPAKDAGGTWHGTGWHDGTSGTALGNEIGDLANLDYTILDGYVVQREWSNYFNRDLAPLIDTYGGVTPPPGRQPSKTSGSSAPSRRTAM